MAQRHHEGGQDHGRSAAAEQQCAPVPSRAPPLPSRVRPPRHCLLAGTLEPGFHRATRAWARLLRERGVEVDERERVCGHDPLMWQEELPGAIAWAFPTPVVPSASTER